MGEVMDLVFIAMIIQQQLIVGGLNTFQVDHSSPLIGLKDKCYDTLPPSEKRKLLQFDTG